MYVCFAVGTFYTSPWAYPSKAGAGEPEVLPSVHIFARRPTAPQRLPRKWLHKWKQSPSRWTTEINSHLSAKNVVNCRKLEWMDHIWMLFAWQKGARSIVTGFHGCISAFSSECIVQKFRILWLSTHFQGVYICLNVFSNCLVHKVLTLSESVMTFCVRTVFVKFYECISVFRVLIKMWCRSWALVTLHEFIYLTVSHATICVRICFSLVVLCKMYFFYYLFCVYELISYYIIIMCVFLVLLSADSNSIFSYDNCDKLNPDVMMNFER